MKIAIVGQQDFGKAVLEAFLARRLAEILLADDRDFHAAFLGGALRAPALFSELILPWS